MKNTILVVIILIAFNAYTQIPDVRLGGTRTLEIATWNVEWFGHHHDDFSKDKGPKDEEKQLKKLLENSAFLDFDIIGLQEIVSQDYFDRILSESDYEGVRSDEGSKRQEVALIYNPASVELKDQKVILKEKERMFAYRPPHMFQFSDKTGVLGGDFYVIVVHLKAHIPSASFEKRKESYERRKEAGRLMGEYIDNNLPDEQVIIIGDWNDDVDVSNFNKEETPFLSLMNSPNYDFATEHLSIAGQTSSVYGSVIDHILISNELFDKQYQTGIALLESYDKDYTDDVSDHYPVYIIFR